MSMIERNSKIAVLVGGWSHEANLSGYPTIVKAIRELELEPVILDCTDPKLAEKILSSEVKIAFPASHGAFHEDGKLQGFLEFLNIPYVGSGVAASAVGMNKLLAKYFFIGCGFRTPKFEWMNKERIYNFENICDSLGDRFVAKPVFSGASFGVELIESEDQFDEYVSKNVAEFGDILLEEFIDGGGQEFSVSTVQIDGRVEDLPVCKIITEGGLFDYSTKFTRALVNEEVPAVISNELSAQLRALGREVFESLGCSGFLRSDFVVDLSGREYLLEVNTLPGLLPDSIFPKACRAQGISFVQMVKLLLESALRPKPMEVERQNKPVDLPEDISKALQS